MAYLARTDKLWNTLESPDDLDIMYASKELVDFKLSKQDLLALKLAQSSMACSNLQCEVLNDLIVKLQAAL